MKAAINYEDLPIQGFTKNLDSIGLEQPVKIKQGAILDIEIARLLKYKIESTANKLNADIYHTQCCDDLSVTFWFKQKLS